MPLDTLGGSPERGHDKCRVTSLSMLWSRERERVLKLQISFQTTVYPLLREDAGEDNQLEQ